MKTSLRLVVLFLSSCLMISGCHENNNPNQLLSTSPENAIIQEGGSTKFMLSLKDIPENNVSIVIQNTQTDLVQISNQTLEISQSNWNLPHLLTVTCVDNNVYQGDQTIRLNLTLYSTDPDFNNIPAGFIEITCIDDETGTTPVIPIDPNNLNGSPGILVSPSNGLNTSESGATAIFNVILTGEPTNDVTIPIVSSDPSEGLPNTNTLIFTPANWNQSQTVTVSGIDDAETDGNVSYEIILGPAQSQDTRYNNMPVNTHIQCINLDNETNSNSVSFNVSTSFINITENGAPSTFTIAANTQPTSNIDINISVTDTSEAAVSPSHITFTPENYSTPQTISVSGRSDSIIDGLQQYQIQFTTTSNDSRYNNYTIPPIPAQTKDSDIDASGTVTIRTMAANITSGTNQGYSEGHGIRIFQALKPDIIMIQEFNMYSGKDDTEEDLRQLVDTAFGPEYYYYHGTGEIPNGVISRYPILDSGFWESNIIHNRNWDWAVVDLPGPKDLLAISVHLSTDKNGQEIPVLINKIQSKLDTDAANGLEYFVMIGGDFNTKTRNAVKSEFSDIFKVSAPYPEDQNGNDNTNSSREHPYDYLLCSHDWCQNEIPIEIGSHTYTNGHVFDSRVYSELSELDDVPPVQAGDSDDRGMQHMAIIRDFKYTY